MEKIKLFILDDNRFLRDGLAAMIDKQPDLKVVASLGNADKITERIHLTRPHVLLLDLGLRNQNSLSIAKTVRAELPSTKVVVMDLVPIEEDIYEFVQAGVSGFILKDATVKTFLDTIRAVAGGASVLPSLLTDSLFSQVVKESISLAKSPEAVTESFRMTKRERQVILLIAEGMSNKEIGSSLHLSTFTIKSHVHNILEKLAVHNRLQIANYAHTSDDFSVQLNSISLIERDA